MNQVDFEGKARKTLKKLLAQDKVFSFLQEQTKKTGESIETVAYKFAIEAKGSLEDRQIEKDNEEEISKKTKEAHNRLKKALNGEDGAEILRRTSEHFGGFVFALFTRLKSILAFIDFSMLQLVASA